MKGRDLVERYIYAVIKKLPFSKRSEVEEKLRERINDAQAETDEDIRGVLSEIGNPAAVADEYRGRERALIGPALYETYILVLKIVLAAVGIGLLIASAIQVASGGLTDTDPVRQIWQAFSSILGNVWNGMLASFGMVTLIFALVEHYSDSNDLQKMQSELHDDKPWDPDSLPQVPVEKLRIKRSDPIVSIVFSLIFLMIINTMPELIGLYRQGTQGLQITGFFGAGFIKNLTWISIAVILGIMLEILKLAYGKWNWLQVIAGLMQNAFSFVVAMKVIRDPDFINPSFVTEVNRFLIDAGANSNVRWASYLVTALTVIVIFGFIVDTLTIASKGYYLKSGDL